MKITLQDQIGEIVTQDYRTAAIFKAQGIDFCCRGKRTLDEVLREKGIEPSQLIHDLKRATADNHTFNIPFAEWPLDLLVDYIEKKHHRYVKSHIPVITEYLNKVCKSHSHTHPVLDEIRNLFLEGATELIKHIEEEEAMLFPVIRNIAAPVEIHDPNSCIPPSLLDHMVAVMMYDHLREGDRWKEINAMSGNVRLGCNVAFVTFALLHEFEEDLYEHIHLENNILFPSAIRIRKEVMSAIQS